MFTHGDSLPNTTQILYYVYQKYQNDSNFILIDHIANPQNDAWWEGQGHIFRPFPSHNASNVALALPIILEISDMVYT